MLIIRFDRLFMGEYMFSFILFDFDGTLMDTSEGVFHSFDKVVERYGLKADKSVYSSMIGPPLRESFSQTLALPQSEIQNAIETYREYYCEKGLFEARVYDGITDLLQKLRAAGKSVFVATSKPELYARQILERKGMLELFDFVGGSDEAETERASKADVIRYVLESNGISGRKEQCLLIGDRKYDVEGAHEAGISCAGILWGFGTKAEFEACGADFILKTPADAARFILNQPETL